MLVLYGQHKLYNVIEYIFTLIIMLLCDWGATVSYSLSPKGIIIIEYKWYALYIVILCYIELL